MHADEHDLETADKEAQRKEHIAAVAERLAHRFAGRLLEGVRMVFAPLDHHRGERRHQQADRGQRQQRSVPSHMRQQQLRKR